MGNWLFLHPISEASPPLLRGSGCLAVGSRVQLEGSLVYGAGRDMHPDPPLAGCSLGKEECAQERSVALFPKEFSLFVPVHMAPLPIDVTSYPLQRSPCLLPRVPGAACSLRRRPFVVGSFADQPPFPRLLVVF